MLQEIIDAVQPDAFDLDQRIPVHHDEFLLGVPFLQLGERFVDLIHFIGDFEDLPFHRIVFPFAQLSTEDRLERLGNMLVDEMGHHAFFDLLQHGAKLQGIVLDGRFDIADENFSVVVTAGNFIELLPVDSDAMAFFDIGQCFGILDDFPRMLGNAMLLEFEFAGTPNDSLQVGQRMEIRMNAYNVGLLSWMKGWLTAAVGSV